MKISRDIKCFEWAAGAVAYNSLSFDGVYPAIDISTPLNVTAGGTQDDSGREVAAGGCPTSEQDCLVGRRDLLDSGAAAGGFRSGFRFWSDPFPRCGHGRAFTYNYVKSHLKHAALHDLSASQSEAARSECVVHVKAASEANLQATNTRHGSNTLQNGTQYQTHNSSFITHNSGEKIIGRFLSPDPVLQDPANAQNYNKYSYVLNNPLKFTDPSGYMSSSWNFGQRMTWFTMMSNSWNRYFSNTGLSRDMAADCMGEKAITLLISAFFVDAEADGHGGAGGGGNGGNNTPGGQSGASQSGGNNDYTSGAGLIEKDKGDPEWFRNVQCGNSYNSGVITNTFKWVYSFDELSKWIDNDQSLISSATGAGVDFGLYASGIAAGILLHWGFGAALATIALGYDWAMTDLSNNLEALEDKMKNISGSSNIYLVVKQEIYGTTFYGTTHSSTTYSYYLYDGTLIHSHLFNY